MADARGEYWYLEPGQDASKITVPELRSILLKHGVNYSSAAKKATLVQLFNDHILPQAAKIQRASARTKRSTKGIEDVPSSQASTTTEDPEDETLIAPPPTTRRASRRTTRALTEEEPEPEVQAPVPSSRRKAPSSTVPNKHARAPEEEIEERPTARRTRKSATPAVKQEPLHEDESPFTQENPFQSGSSPSAPETASRDRRRKTMGFEHREKRKSDVHRRRTAQPRNDEQQDGAVVPTRRTFDVPLARAKKEELEYDGAETGEEFTPEEQLELVRERAKAGEVDILPPRQRKRRPKASGTLKALSLTLLGTAVTVLGGVWRQEKFEVGFCGIGPPATSLAGVEVPEWATPILPQCEPCPPHAMCYQGLEVVCDRDFTKQHHPLSLGGLIPLPPTCEPDSEKMRRIGVVVDRGVELLREHRAQYECGEPDKHGKVVESPEISEAELKQELASQKKKGMSQEEFDSLWSSAIGDIAGRQEVVENTDGPAGERRLASDSLAKLSLGCSIKRSLRQTVERHIWQLVLILVVLSTGLWGRNSVTSNRAMEARAKQLASNVFDRLANHAALNNQEPGAYPELGVSMTQLRDDILRTEFSSSRRQRLWERVQKKVEHNSNVRAAVREGRSGDVARMWEWIGPVQLLEDGRSSGKRESGRFNAIGSSPYDDSTLSHEMAQRNNPKWDEGRPIY
ncbi:Man1-Src1p-C-terminal domain-containing protein [Lophiotrema nucula]|uniref:Man1-Src1p-C-terminal domain-containing protein n=1 Tax=Lophiotrema nucula TaxID=690887 RepID=A0A6A5Z771_9PLEO|nr:Man1-Src1p-C-terminal domain-containing protein [Lophiotrema nucula]